MVRVMLFMVLMFGIAEANASRYYIQLGSFKQLKVLEKSIDTLPIHLRSHVVVIRSNGWYVPFAYYLPQKDALYAKVPAYKQYFPDAYINKSSYLLNHPIVRNYSQPVVASSYRRPIPAPLPSSSYVSPSYQSNVTSPQPVVQYQNVAISEADNTLNLPLQFATTETVTAPMKTAISEIPFESEPEKRYKYFNKKMLSGKHYYLAYKSSKETPNLLIKVTFANHEVTYQPVIGDMQMTQANYLVEENKLYMFADTFTKDGAYSVLDEHRNNHFLVSSWINGKKLNTLRYYYNLNDAKKYLGLETSEGLASTLAEGSFDEYFLNEE